MAPYSVPGITRKVTYVLATAVMIAFSLVGAGAVPAAAIAPSCNLPGHWYAEAGSGTGNYGTADQIWTWNHWSVYDPSGGGFSDEAVWSINPFNQNDSLEVGFFSGYGKDNIGGDPNWSNGMVPYYTENAGNNEYDEWGTYLSSNQYIYMIAQANNNGSFAYVAGPLDVNLNYVVSQPRWNLTQGETVNTATWMGGGSGDSSTNYWIDSSGNMHPWQYMNICWNSPYWASTSNGDYFENGGY